MQTEIGNVNIDISAKVELPDCKTMSVVEVEKISHDYTRKGGVVHTEIMLPPHAPPSFADRSTLWNSVELYEKAGNAQLAR